jgi:hydrogenase maturation protein HypF
VLAVKGLGGYHLACDADDEAAVATLRRRKRRGGKAFAVMVRDLQVARELARVDDVEAGLLTGPARPIVLVPRRADSPRPLAPSVAPGSGDLGLLLPYTPLHVLLFGLDGDEPGPRALVMTSGNVAGEPIATDDDDALTRLAPLVDGWLRHDRPIAAPCDDSVVRVVDGEVLPLRRARGWVPLPVALPVDVAPALAVGGDLKSACCLGAGRRAWPSQHLGDLDDLATLTALGVAERRLEALTGVRPARLVADPHPGYRSTRWARDSAGHRPLRTVQHHHAHVAAVMGEHGLDGSAPVLGFAFDGTGHGADGTVWGGEVLVADYAGYQRWACLAPVSLPGGDAAVRRPYRMALAHLAAAGVPWDDDLPCVAACPPAERGVLAHQLATGLGCVPTSSVGRLVDAVASLAGVRQEVDSEAQAAIELEGLARGVTAPDPPYAFALRDPAPGGPLLADAAPVMRAVADDVRRGMPAALVSARFHAALAGLVRALAARARGELGLTTVVLAGGVFANAVLLGAATRGLREDGSAVLRPRLLPPGDGGLAYGQLLVGAERATD